MVTRRLLAVGLAPLALCATAGARPVDPGPHATVPTVLRAGHVVVLPAIESFEEGGTFLPLPAGSGPVAAYGVVTDPAEILPSSPAASIPLGALVRVVPQVTNARGIVVAYDRIGLRIGATETTLPVNAPIWRIAATGTYLASVTLHYTWQAPEEVGAGTQTVSFKLHVPRPA